MKILALFILAPALVLLAGCAHYPINQPLERFEPAGGYRFSNLPVTNANSDRVLITLAFSGGGTRAAALSYGVLEELARTAVVVNGQTKRLLDEVDSVSAVSGGSFTAAYFALHGDGIFVDFQERFLNRNVQGALLARLFFPHNWIRLMSPWFGRSDLAAEFYDQQIFGKATFADLFNRGQRPYLTLNATDMSQEARFEFTQEQFDLLCSDLSSFSLGRAVAASSAFPIILSPITIRNYAGQCAYDAPAWIASALKDESSARRRIKAMDARSYLDSTNRPYIHLLDGGIADNLGLRGPLDSVIAMGGAASLMREFKLEQVEKVVLIVVDAAVKSDRSWDRRETAPGIAQVAWAMGSVPVSRYSLETLELVKQSIEAWTRELRQPNRDGDVRRPIEFYPIIVSFDSLENETDHHFFQGIPSNFHLGRSTVDRLRETGGILLRRSENFHKLLADLHSPRSEE